MNEVNWLMVVTAAILIVAAMLGYINGLIKTILNLVLGIVTLVLVILLSPRVCDFLQANTPLPGYIETKVESMVWEQLEQQYEQGPSLEGAEMEAFVEKLPFLPALKEAVLENDEFQMQAQQGMKEFSSYVGRVVSEKVIVLIAYAATFVVVYIALRILAFVLDVIGHLPIINGINKMTGLAAGLIEGLMIVWILGILLAMFNTTQLGQSAAQCIEESRFLSIVYGYNLLQEIFFWVIG